jgi:2-keto-3-deoxy-L-rhamnonate aldolase RhmA
MALDGGAHGVLIPYCETAEEVRAVVTAARLRPLKGAALESAMAGGPLPSDAARDYLAKRNANVVVFIGIESVTALENLEAILDAGEAAGGIDGFMIGPNDLSISLGLPEQYEHPRYVEAVERIIRVAAARGVAAGPQCMTADSAAFWKEKGARFLLLSSDWRALAEGFRPLLARVRGDAGGPVRRPA